MTWPSVITLTTLVEKSFAKSRKKEHRISADIHAEESRRTRETEFLGVLHIKKMSVMQLVHVDKTTWCQLFFCFLSLSSTF